MSAILLVALVAASGRAARRYDPPPLTAEMGRARRSTNATSIAEVDSMFKPQPLIVNRASLPVVVYLERGFLFNTQVIRPGEAAQLYSSLWGPHVLPYDIVALVGDESSMPSDFDSLLKFVGASAVPAAFVAGVAASVLSAGTLAGPAAALVPWISNVVIGGMEITAADWAVGLSAAEMANQVSNLLVREHSAAFMTRVQAVPPGRQYFEIVGGPVDTVGTELRDLKIRPISYKRYKSYDVAVVKLCESLRTKGFSGTVEFTIGDCGDQRLRGKWWRVGDHSGRPRYSLIDDDQAIIEWSASRGVWRAFYDTTWSGHGRATLYESPVDSSAIPETGWVAVAGDLPAPAIEAAAKAAG